MLLLICKGKSWAIMDNFTLFRTKYGQPKVQQLAYDNGENKNNWNDWMNEISQLWSTHMCARVHGILKKKLAASLRMNIWEARISNRTFQDAQQFEDNRYRRKKNRNGNFEVQRRHLSWTKSNNQNLHFFMEMINDSPVQFPNTNAHCKKDTHAQRI